MGLVLNLHDGSGYYRHTYEDKLLRNPARAGTESVIIDQTELPGAFMGALEAEADKAAQMPPTRRSCRRGTVCDHS